MCWCGSGARPAGQSVASASAPLRMAAKPRLPRLLAHARTALFVALCAKPPRAAAASQEPECGGAGAGAAPAAACRAARGQRQAGTSEDSGPGGLVGCGASSVPARGLGRPGATPGAHARACPAAPCSCSWAGSPPCTANGSSACPLPLPPQRAKPGARLQRVPILRNVSSVLRPGRLTLLLGPPGSGKSMLMRALCGQLKWESKLKVGGRGSRGHPRRCASWGCACSCQAGWEFAGGKLQSLLCRLRCVPVHGRPCSLPTRPCAALPAGHR